MIKKNLLPRFILIPVWLSFFTAPLCAQPLDERLQFEVGGHLSLLQFDITSSYFAPGQQQLLFLQGTKLGVNYTYWSKFDRLSLNVNISPAIGLHAPYNRIRIFYMLPIGILARVGAASMALNNDFIGAGAGFSFVYWKLNLKQYEVQLTNGQTVLVNDIGDDNGSAILGNFEVSFGKQKLMTVRLDYPLTLLTGHSSFVGINIVTVYRL